jgi:hypothetical protein
MRYTKDGFKFIQEKDQISDVYLNLGSRVTTLLHEAGRLSREESITLSVAMLPSPHGGVISLSATIRLRDGEDMTVTLFETGLNARSTEETNAHSTR